MRAELLLLFLIVGAGNYLMRFLPLLWALRGGEPDDPGRSGGSRGFLTGPLPFVGPSVVAALLVSSLLGAYGGGAGEVMRAAGALLPTVLVALRYGNLGLTVIVGVGAYWLISQAA